MGSRTKISPPFYRLLRRKSSELELGSMLTKILTFHFQALDVAQDDVIDIEKRKLVSGPVHCTVDGIRPYSHGAYG